MAYTGHRSPPLRGGAVSSLTLKVTSVFYAVTPNDGGEPVESYSREDEIENWIRVDEGARRAPREVDQGWRLRLEHEDDEGHFELVEEQVFPERVLRVANHVKTTRKGVRMNLAEAVWLRERLDRDIIPKLERQGQVAETSCDCCCEDHCEPGCASHACRAKDPARG